MTKNTAADYWNEFRQTDPRVKTDYQAHQAWSFGNSRAMADELLALVLAGTKQATASLYQLYRWTNEPLPQVGDFSVILDGAQVPSCIIETTAVEVVPFASVTAEHARLEGEGDLSLTYWREVHWQFFSHQAAAAHHHFNEDDLVVCERFKVVYR